MHIILYKLSLADHEKVVPEWAVFLLLLIQDYKLNIVDGGGLDYTVFAFLIILLNVHVNKAKKGEWKHSRQTANFKKKAELPWAGFEPTISGLHDQRSNH